MISETTGKIFCWACVALVIVLCYEIISRYIFNRPNMWGQEVPRMIGATIVSMGFAYTLLHRGHVRVDFIYSRLSLRKRAIVDVICSLLLFFPLLAALVYKAWTTMLFSWVHGEKWTLTIWFPPITPLRTILLIGLIIFSFQAIAIFLQDLKSLREGRSK